MTPTSFFPSVIQVFYTYFLHFSKNIAKFSRNHSKLYLFFKISLKFQQNVRILFCCYFSVTL